MIPNIGFIICTYAIARLIQIPVEQSTWAHKVPFLTVVSMCAGAVIAMLGIELALASASFDPFDPTK